MLNITLVSNNPQKQMISNHERLQTSTSLEQQYFIASLTRANRNASPL